jgi:hypothetical protein
VRSTAQQFGSDLTTLETKARQARDVLSKVRGITGITLVRELGQPSLIIQPDRAKIARYGLNVSDINTLIETAVGGTLRSAPGTSLAGRQESGGVHAEAPEVASELHQDGGVGQWQNGIFRVGWHGVSLGTGKHLCRPHEWLPWEAKSKSGPPPSR